MRPSAVADGLQSRSRKSSLVDHQTTTPLADPRNAGPATFFLAREDEMEDSETRDSDHPRDSSYGVESLENTISVVTESPRTRDIEEDEAGSPAPRRRSTIKAVGSPGEAAITSSKPASITASNPRHSPQIPTSQPLTPLFIGYPGDASSLPSSPKSTSTRSFKPSDEDSGVDETGSQAITSGGEEEAELPSEIQDSAPQLIMPSIKMPSRRPFTQRGKDMGRFKVLIAGGTGEYYRFSSVLLAHGSLHSPTLFQMTLCKAFV